eukprot:2319514-Alexandrium_andersonii.AAC.1
MGGSQGQGPQPPGRASDGLKLVGRHASCLADHRAPVVAGAEARPGRGATDFVRRGRHLKQPIAKSR